MTERGLIETDVVKAREVAKQAARTLKPLRTERTLRMMAKEMAGAWWDESVKIADAEKLDSLTPEEKAFARKRSDMFRAMWPDQKIYVTICWPHFYKMARQQAISMLDANSGIAEHMKARIYDAVCEDFNKNG